MAAPESFDAYYAREIDPELQARETKRKAAVRNWIVCLAVGLVLGLALLLLTRVNPRQNEWPLILAAVCAVGGFAIGQSFLGSVATDVKGMLLPKVAGFLGASYSSFVTDESAVRRFRQQKLIPSYDRSRFEDEISGPRAETTFTLFEAELKNRHTDSKGRTTYVTVFRGQLLRVAFPQKFLGVTVVMRDAGWFNSFIKPNGEMKRVGLVDPTFEKTFEVFGTDQVEARYLLTPDFMERLLALEEILKGKKARAAFADGDLLIAIEGGNLFEPGSMFEPLANPERANRVLKEIQSVHDVIDALLAAKKAGIHS